MANGYNLSVSSQGPSRKRTKVKDSKTLINIIKGEIEQHVSSLVCKAVKETVAEHNERVITQAAIFFQRVVTRTPKDETYYDPYTKRWHIKDEDDVWKAWTIRYRGKSVTAEQMGLSLFDTPDDFNDKHKIESVAYYIVTYLFGSEEKFLSKAYNIRNIKIENLHPRFAMLEYGEYQHNHSPAKSGDKYVHGVTNGYSYQAPVGMQRITQAEIEAYSAQDLDNWRSKDYTSKMAGLGVTVIPTKQEAHKMLEFMKNRRHLAINDINRFLNDYGKYAGGLK